MGGPGERHGAIGFVEKRRASAGLHDLPDGAAHVDVDHVGAVLGRDRGRLPHHVGVVPEELDRDRVLVGVDAEIFIKGAPVAVLQAEARHHLAEREPRAVPARLEPQTAIALKTPGLRPISTRETGRSASPGSTSPSATAPMPPERITTRMSA